ncbi:uncharacterized protein LOC113788996 [Dermatophagoides pteronyssinus]|uniref:Uncharacterized protein n=2 Tax=Dermatophagoides pteronyssinus TaxID=6956 RepID=A0ABQ8IPU6_DERPT|nr:uncharacterized protein LOC113788996 [Dermatophagoides pteronyssinus]KAH9412387.1 hypothetical protein DERP_013630 [Dermatophagoides pteronyssinus]
MKFSTIFAITLATSSMMMMTVMAANKKNKIVAAASEPSTVSVQPADQTPRRPKINWGRCPQLEPTERDIESKSNILQECLRQNPPPQSESITQEQIIQHQQKVTECALKIENWFDKNGEYKYSKAEKEIKNKNLAKDMEKKLLESHKQCSQIAKDRSQAVKNMTIVEQVQVYQGCMDAHITQNCQIEISAV